MMEKLLWWLFRISLVKKEKPSEEFPLYINNREGMSHYLTGVQTRKSPTLAGRNFESFMEIHPATAKKFGIQDKTLVKIESKTRKHYR